MYLLSVFPCGVVCCMGGTFTLASSDSVEDCTGSRTIGFTQASEEDGAEYSRLLSPTVKLSSGDGSSCLISCSVDSIHLKWIYVIL